MLAIDETGFGFYFEKSKKTEKIVNDPITQFKPLLSNLNPFCLNKLQNG